MDNASGETIKEKLEVTKKVVDSNGEVREDHFVAEMEDEEPQLESSQEEKDDEEDPKVAEEPAEKEVQETNQNQNEASSTAGSENSGKPAESTDDEEFQKRMDDFSESLGSLLTDAVNTQRRLRKEMEDGEEQVDVGNDIKLEVGGRKLKEIVIDGVKILTADNDDEKSGKKASKSGKFTNIPPTKVMREHEVDGIKIMTTVDLENKGLGSKLENQKKSNQNQFLL